MPKVHGFMAEPRKPAEMYALAKTKPRVWLKLSLIHQKLVQFGQNPLKYVTICCSNFGLLLANQTPYFGQSQAFTKTPNYTQYRNRNVGQSLFNTIKVQAQVTNASCHRSICC